MPAHARAGRPAARIPRRRRTPRTFGRHDGGAGGRRDPARPDDGAGRHHRRPSRRRGAGVPRPPPDPRRARRPHEPPGRPPRRAGLGCHTERDALAGHETRPGPPGDLHAQPHRVPRVDARRRGRRASRRSTSTTATSPRSCGTCSPTPGPRPSSCSRAFAPTLAAVLPDLPRLRVIVQVRRRVSGHDLLPGAVWYDDALAAASARRRRRRRRRADDLYILYTGGTTGMPKGVLWRNGDAMIECFGASPDGDDGRRVRRRGRRPGCGR